MTETNWSASGRKAGRGNEQANGSSDPNTADYLTRTYRDPVTNRVILRMRRTRSDLVIVDLECKEAQFFARRFFPAPTHRIIRSDKKSRWVYRVRS